MLYLCVFLSLVLFLSPGFAFAEEETKSVKVITDYRSKLSSERALEEARLKKLELEKSALQPKEERVRKNIDSEAKHRSLQKYIRYAGINGQSCICISGKQSQNDG